MELCHLFVHAYNRLLVQVLQDSLRAWSSLGVEGVSWSDLSYWEAFRVSIIKDEIVFCAMDSVPQGIRDGLRWRGCQNARLQSHSGHPANAGSATVHNRLTFTLCVTGKQPKAGAWGWGCVMSCESPQV